MNTQANNKVKAVAGCPLASKPMKMNIAISIQNIGDSGSRDTLRFISQAICPLYNPTNQMQIKPKEEIK